MRVSRSLNSPSRTASLILSLIHICQMTLDRSLLSANTAGDGGGARVGQAGTLVVVNSTLSGNSAAVDGGGLFTAGTTSLINATLSGNTAGVRGGGALAYGGSLTLQRSLLAGNSAPDGREARRMGGAVTAAAHNLFGFGGDAGLSGLSAGASDVTPAVALGGVLRPLAHNGGPTLSHALAVGSPAIDVAPSADCAVAPVGGVDQRGLPRNVDGDGQASAAECDIGAVEAGPAEHFVYLPVVVP